MLKREWGYEKSRMRECLETYPARLETANEKLANVQADKQTAKNTVNPELLPFENSYLQSAIKRVLDNYRKDNFEPIPVGKIGGFEVSVIAEKLLSMDETAANPYFVIKGIGEYSCPAGVGEKDNNVLRLKTFSLLRLTVVRKKPQTKFLNYPTILNRRVVKLIYRLSMRKK